MELGVQTVIVDLLIIYAFYGSCVAQHYLSVDKTRLVHNDEKVFLSGVNQAWWNYGKDFGNDSYATSKPHFIQTLDAIQKSGGNSIRIWLHVTGGNSPDFNSSGHVTGLNKNFTRDLVDLVLEAEKRNILVTYTLWNCAVIKDNMHEYGLLTDEGKLQSYVTNALVPMVTALRTRRGLGMWEIINEPEGCVKAGVHDSEEPCYDTSTLHVTDFPDWSLLELPLKHMLRFIAVQTSAIHATDPKALVTVGSWTYRSVTDQLDRRNFYSDDCLRYAGGGLPGTSLDVYQMHAYAILHLIYLPHNPFLVNASVYGLDKPLIIGEFSQRSGGSVFTSEELFTWAYYHGYNGAWSWCARYGDGMSDSMEVQERGMRSLRGKNDQSAGGRVNIVLQQPGAMAIAYETVLWILQTLLLGSAISWFA